MGNKQSLNYKFNTTSSIFNKHKITFVKITDDTNEPITIKTFITALKLSDYFMNSFRHALLSYPDADELIFECCPITPNNYDTAPFEFVLIPSYGYTFGSLRTDENTFIPHFNQGTEKVTSFPDLIDDAILISPCYSDTNYNDQDAHNHPFTHFNNFVKYATLEDFKNLWTLVAITLENKIKGSKLQPNSCFWLSVNRINIPWLHIRIDTKPLYYKYTPYKPIVHAVTQYKYNIINYM